jgi:hypothetical protein
MLILTKAAKQHLASVLDSSGAEDDISVRMVLNRGAWLIALDREAPDDETFDYQGRTVLLLAQSEAKALERKTLDVYEADEGDTILTLA